MSFTRIVFIFLWLVLQTTVSFATQEPFSVVKANKRFDQINIKLSTQNLDVRNLETAIIELESLQKQAKACVEENENQLKLISEATTNQFDIDKKAEGNKSKYLNDEQRNYHSNLVRCKLFVLRTKESIAAFKETISKISASALLNVESTLWDLFNINPLASLSQTKLETIVNNTGVLTLSRAIAWTLLGALVLSLCLGITCAHALKKHPHKLSHTLSKFIIPILFFGTASLFFWLADRNSEVDTIFELGAYALLITSVFLSISYYIFGSVSKHKSTYIRIVILVYFVLLCYLTQVVFTDQNFEASLYNLCSIVYITILNGLTAWLLWVHAYRFKAYSTRIYLKSLLVTFFFANTLIVFFGYIALSQFLVYGLLLTVLLCNATYFFVKAVGSVIHGIQNRQLFFAQKMLEILGVKPRRNLSELLLIQFSIYLMVLASFLLSLFKIWQIPENYIYNMETVFIDGFNFSSVSISLLSLIYALLIFSFLSLLGRAISTRISKKHHFSEHDRQSAIASIVSYISFCVATIAALIVLGINFTGLAIIVGALSVGIGLGLQTIVNNFVSGLILLIEKPIKSGDRILVNGIEGFVRKVRIRSTQIMTLSKEDVMIPNSDLITYPVTNFMFRNNIWRVTVKVGVAYGSDTELVKNTLMEVALNHEPILKDAPHEPSVLFKEFGDSSLLFELWCVIPDVNKKYFISSELHFKIAEAFQQRGITIAFPQRDIHIKTAPATTKI